MCFNSAEKLNLKLRVQSILLTFTVHDYVAKTTEQCLKLFISQNHIFQFFQAMQTSDMIQFIDSWYDPVPFVVYRCHFSSARSLFRRLKQYGRVSSWIYTSHTRHRHCMLALQALASRPSPTASSSSCLKKSLLCCFLNSCRTFCKLESRYLTILAQRTAHPTK